VRKHDKADPLTRGKYATVDEEDFDRVSQFKWQYHLDTGNGNHESAKVLVKDGGEWLVVLPALSYGYTPITHAPNSPRGGCWK